MDDRNDSDRHPPPDEALPNSERDRVLGSFMLHYAEVQYAFVRFLSEHLADCCKRFDGDLDLPMILAVVGQSHIAAFVAQGQPATGQIDYGVSALRIADVTGLPRETVRRKLKRLETLGWIRQGARGWSLDGPSAADANARRDLDDLNRRGLERLARLHCDLSRTLSRPG